jgi:hypothetical protein
MVDQQRSNTSDIHLKAETKVAVGVFNLSWQLTIFKPQEKITTK